MLALVGVEACVAAQPALPPITDADRAAAFPDLSGHSHAMLEDPFDRSLRVDELESQQTDRDDVLAWKAHACAVARRALTQAEWTQFLGGRAYTPACR